MKNVWQEMVWMPVNLDSDKRVVEFGSIKRSRVELLRMFWQEVQENGYITARQLRGINRVITRNATRPLEE